MKGWNDRKGILEYHLSVLVEIRVKHQSRCKPCKHSCSIEGVIRRKVIEIFITKSTALNKPVVGSCYLLGLYFKNPSYAKTTVNSVFSPGGTFILKIRHTSGPLFYSMHDFSFDSHVQPNPLVRLTGALIKDMQLLDEKSA